MPHCYFTINSNKNFFSRGDRWDPLENEVTRKKPGIKQYHNKFIGFFRWLFGNAYWIKNKTTKTSIFIVKNSWIKWKERNRPQENYTIHTFVNEIRDKLSKPVKVIPIPPKVEIAPSVDIKKEVGEVCDGLQKQIDDFIALGFGDPLDGLKGQVEKLRQGSQVEEEPFKTWLEGDNLQKRCLVLPQMLQRHLGSLIISQSTQKAKIAFSYHLPTGPFPLMTHLNKYIGTVKECELLLKEWLEGNLSPTKLKKLKENLKFLDSDFNSDHPQLEKLSEALRLNTIDQETFDAFILSYKCDLCKTIYILPPKKWITKDREEIEESLGNSYEELKENLQKLDAAKATKNVEEFKEQIQAVINLPELGKVFTGQPVISTYNFPEINRIAIILPEIEAWAKKHPNILEVDLEKANETIKATLEYIEGVLRREINPNLKVHLKALKEDINHLYNNPRAPKEKLTEMRFVLDTTFYTLPLIPKDRNLAKFTLACNAIFPEIYRELEKKYYLGSLAKACLYLQKNIQAEMNRILKDVVNEKISDIIKKISCFEGILISPPDILKMIEEARHIEDPHDLAKALVPTLGESVVPVDPTNSDPVTIALFQKKFIWDLFSGQTLESFKLPFIAETERLGKKINAIKLPQRYTVEDFFLVAENYEKSINEFSNEIKKMEKCAKLLNRGVDKLILDLIDKKAWLSDRKKLFDYHKAHAKEQVYNVEEVQKNFGLRKELLNTPVNESNSALLGTLKGLYAIAIRFLNSELHIHQLDTLQNLNLPISIDSIQQPPFPFLYNTVEWKIIHKISFNQALKQLSKALINFDILILKEQIVNNQQVNPALLKENHPVILKPLRNYIFEDTSEYFYLKNGLDKKKNEILTKLPHVQHLTPVQIHELTDAFTKEIDEFEKNSFTKTHETIEVLKKISDNPLLQKWDALSFFEKLGAKGMNIKIKLIENLFN